MGKKYHYKAKDYSSKLELMEAHGLTSAQFESLFKMGRIQMSTNEDMVDFAGVWLGKNRNSNNENKDNNER